MSFLFALPWVAWVWGGILLLLLLVLVFLYNSLVAKRNQARNAYATVDVMLKKRYDLVPNLVDTVKGYAAHEKELFQQIARLRSQALSAASPKDALQMDAQMTPLVRQLFAVVENYPQLKANENFLHLQRTLAELEEQLSAARRFYNSAVLEYNNALQTFPGNVIAGVLGFQADEFFTLGAGEAAVPSTVF